METLSFAFGMLTVIGVAIATVVVLGIVKVFKMEKMGYRYESIGRKLK